MENKSIIFTSPSVASFMNNELPPLNEDEITVKLVRSTISAGTERALLTGDPNINSSGAPSVVFPRRSGYSSSGVVVAVGSAVTEFKVGDRVACSWTNHAQYNNVKTKRAYKLDDATDYDEAALVHIATFPLAAMRKCNFEFGESAMIMGLGVLGLLAVELLRAAGAAPLIAVDPVPGKREQAIALGADYALDPFDPDFAKTVKEITGGGVKVCIEVTGLGSGLDMALDCMARFGRVALLGCTRNSDFSIDYYRKVHGPGVTLVGAHTMARHKYESSQGWWTEADDAKAILRLLVSGRINFKQFIEEIHSPTEAPEVYTRLAEEKFFPVVQFDWTSLEG